MKRSITIWLMVFLFIAPMLASCSSGPAATPTDPPPTRTPFPTFAYIEPTTEVVFEASEPESEDAPTANIELDAKLVGRGRGRYEALQCGSCHGENGEGTSEGKSLLQFNLSEEDFITFVRSGGELGPSHQYSTDRLSNSGSRDLYQYLVSLAQGS
ncbi:MAG: cytochrome c [Chloroflexi bacterium]|nr:cytochrome c [Chloroflexota bacterium]